MTLDLSYRRYPEEEPKQEESVPLPVSTMMDQSDKMIEALKHVLAPYTLSYCDWKDVMKSLDVWFKIECINANKGHVGYAAKQLNIKRTTLTQMLTINGLRDLVKKENSKP